MFFRIYSSEISQPARLMTPEGNIPIISFGIPIHILHVYPMMIEKSHEIFPSFSHYIIYIFPLRCSTKSHYATPIRSHYKNHESHHSPTLSQTKMPTKEVTACVPATTVKLLVCPMIALAMRPISPLRRAYQQSCNRPRAAPWRPGGTVLRGRLPTPQICLGAKLS